MGIVRLINQCSLFTTNELKRYRDIIISFFSLFSFTECLPIFKIRCLKNRVCAEDNGFELYPSIGNDRRTPYLHDHEHCSGGMGTSMFGCETEAAVEQRGQEKGGAGWGKDKTREKVPRKDDRGNGNR